MYSLNRGWQARTAGKVLRGGGKSALFRCNFVYQSCRECSVLLMRGLEGNLGMSAGR